MADSTHAIEPDPVETDSDAASQLDVADRPSPLPARIADYRDQLPGLEPDREVTDWGRSERVEGLVDRTVYDFFYRYWFRVEVEGIEHVPPGGPALLVANHSGALPSDAVMIAKAIREQHGRSRPVHLASEQPLGRLPGVSMLFTKLGGVAAHPANVHRLLFDEEQLVLQFPEGAAGARKPLKDRYRLRTFDEAPFVQSAASAGAPIVPIAVLGAEEALPLLARLSTIRRITRLPPLPTVPLPAKFKIRFLEAVEPDSSGADRERLREDIRALIQENLFEMVGERRSVWLG